MKQYLIVILSIFTTIAYAQNTIISGSVIDANTGESLIGATIIYGKGMGVAADYEGNFVFSIPSGNRKITASYVGYQQESKSIKAEGKSITVKFKLKPIQLSEVHIVGDVAKDRETPVAFTTVSLKKVNEELASQDIPMILNSTPGVYATQSGGGDGDARITIRGFNQRNVAVMIDGIPVNDMENGWVYWSNWSGLDAVTSNIQVQRGLGASKIAIPSVGGTMNILTKGIGNQQSGTIKQDIGSFGRLKTSIGYNSGKLDHGWGFTLAGSYKKGSGFVQETWTEGYFYYAKLQKEIGNHTFTLSAMGAPQKHGQRSYKSDLSTYWQRANNMYQEDSLNGIFKGMNYYHNEARKYNKSWGYLDRWTLDANGDTVHNNSILNTKQNYFHKPQYSLRHFWVVNDKFYISNISYASIGNGGGTSIKGTFDNNYDNNGQIDLQSAYNENVDITSFFNSINPSYSDSLSQSRNYIRSSVNNHYWYGLLSTANYNPSEEISISGGLDLRTYKGEHYGEIYDLLGGDYLIQDPEDINYLNPNLMKEVGDIVGYHNDGFVKWIGGFGQVEYNNGRVSAFFNLSGSNSGYKRHDYFKKKTLVLEDTTIQLGYTMDALFTDTNRVIMVLDTYTDTITGKEYTMNSAEARDAITDWKWIPGFTIKTGANYNINKFHNIFFNVGYISKSPRFNNVFDYDNQLFRDIQNEQVKAIESGYSYRSRFLSANLNAYHTNWINKPHNGGQSVMIDEEIFRANINGMNALHQGIEMDCAYKLNEKITLEGLVSLGNWRWTSSDTARFLDDNNNPVLLNDTTEFIVPFNAEGVHVGDAAQTQYGISFRYEPTSNSYFKVRATRFDDYYSDFDPLSLNGENAGRESWKIPAYQLVDLHAGYKINLTPKNKLDIKFSILNLLDATYISDAQNNDPYNANYQDFDAKSAGVFFGLGRRFNLSAKINF